MAENLPIASRNVGGVTYLLEPDAGRRVVLLTLSMWGKAVVSRYLSQAAAEKHDTLRCVRR
jgi:hypothetical protein